MMSDEVDARVDLVPFSDPIHDKSALAAGEDLTDEASSLISEEALSTLNALAQKLNRQYRRYLVHVEVAPVEALPHFW